jgi:hypothetical protein
MSGVTLQMSGPTNTSLNWALMECLSRCVQEHFNLKARAKFVALTETCNVRSKDDLVPPVASMLGNQNGKLNLSGFSVSQQDRGVFLSIFRC